MYPVACCRDSNTDRLWQYIYESCLKFSLRTGPLGLNDNNNYNNNLNCEEDGENYVISPSQPASQSVNNSVDS
jgi:hypothetical protein